MSLTMLKEAASSPTWRVAAQAPASWSGLTPPIPSLGMFIPSHSCVLLQVEIPNIQKQRKHLAKLVLDMDSSRTR